MITMRNNHVFKGHKTLLGNKFVTYGELELSLRYDLFAESKNGFDWGNISPGSKQLAFSILCQLSNKELAQENASKFAQDVVKSLNSRDWVLEAYTVLSWIKANAQEDVEEKKPENILILQSEKPKIKTKQRVKPKTNIVKEICNELGITQKNLAHILEIPEGTVSSWAVKNEIPRLGKKAIEFYRENQKNQEIIDSYKSFVKLLSVS